MKKLNLPAEEYHAVQALSSSGISVLVTETASKFKLRFVDGVQALLRELGLPPSLLDLEITESILLEDAQRAERLLSALRGLGVRSALDDFGTGFSSLSYLKRLPVDAIKIDLEA